MGRPINKRFIGDPANPGKQITLNSAYLPGAVGPATGFYLKKQTGTGRFLVTDGNVEGVVRLVGEGTLAEGQAHLVANPFGTVAKEYVKVLYNRTLKTWEGNTYRWDTWGATEAGMVDLTFEVEAEADSTPVSHPEIPGNEDEEEPT